MGDLEWQIAEGSRTAHVVDVSKPAGRRTGPVAACGRRPQRRSMPWFSLPVNAPGVFSAIHSYGCTACPDCKEATDAD